MAKRVIRGYWDCQSCGTKGIDGLIDKCPNCGAGKPANTKYYMKGINAVSDAELEKAGIGKDENDGKHKEWVCPYCGQLNNYRDTTCVSCGASKDSKEMEYGDYAKKQAQKTMYTKTPKPSFFQSKLFKILICIAVLLVIALFPLKKTQEVTDRYWQTTVYVEESKIVQEDDWSLPDGATLLETKQEISHYENVIDHYETVAVERSRSVPDGTEEYCTYDDNGNGTFSENCSTVTTYRTEYYTDYEQQPVYRSEPRYATKYYYEIPRWSEVNSYTNTGKDDTPVYNTNYTLAQNQRDTTREVVYYIQLDENDPIVVDASEYVSCQIGSQYTIQHNLLGMEYSRTLEN